MVRHDNRCGSRETNSNLSGTAKNTNTIKIHKTTLSFSDFNIGV